MGGRLETLKRMDAPQWDLLVLTGYLVLTCRKLLFETDPRLTSALT